VLPVTNGLVEVAVEKSTSLLCVRRSTVVCPHAHAAQTAASSAIFLLDSSPMIADNLSLEIKREAESHFDTGSRLENPGVF
jgi:hypothetical protein